MNVVHDNKFLFLYTMKVIVTEKSGMVLHAVISDDHKSLVRGITAKDPSVIAECSFKNSEIRGK